ncbi:MAG: aldo/keto reductase [Candidatus Latescibacteria bacterium]|nr:aldo/keto reductase [Candidatus Latescibacterota bacterium]
MAQMSTRKLGRTGVELTELSFGSAPLGNLFVEVGEEEAQQTLGAAWDAGMRYFDTSPFYGYGKSEHRVGHFLRQRDLSSYVLSTKVGRVFKASTDPANFDQDMWLSGLPFEHVFDYSYDGIMRSYEDSTQRLGLPRIDLLLIHDLDFWFHQNETRVMAYMNQLYTSGWRALEELRSAGLIKGIGAGINEIGMMPRFLDMVDVDFFLVAMRYNMMEQPVLDGEFAQCAEAGVGIVVGAVFASGILATGAIEGAYYNYEPAPPEIMEKARRMEAVCRSHGVELAAAALKFPLGHPLVAAVIPGALNPVQVRANAALFQGDIPADLWAELKAEGLLRPDAPTP